MNTYTTEVCIVGAGPGGCATALHLHKLGIKSLLIDKATFPRDKICGDGLTGKTIAILKRIDPEIITRFDALPKIQLDCWGISVRRDKGKPVNIALREGFNKATDPRPGYISTRVDFDNFLVEETKRCDKIELVQGLDIAKYEQQADKTWLLTNKAGDVTIKTRLLIIANGANSAFSRHNLGYETDPYHNAAAVRAYYNGITDLHKDNYLEFYFFRNFLPGYFWIFPLPDGRANVGFGMISHAVSAKRVNLKKKMLEVIEQEPQLKERFKNAKLESDVTGFPLPLGSKRRQLSGDNYMLVGDAGALIDPLTGEGIGNAIYSGYIAAEQAQKSFAANNLTHAGLKDYDVRVWRVMGPEFKFSHFLQRMSQYPLILDFGFWFISRSSNLAAFAFAMFNDKNVKQRIYNPIFWLKALKKPQ